MTSCVSCSPWGVRRGLSQSADIRLGSVDLGASSLVGRGFLSGLSDVVRRSWWFG